MTLQKCPKATLDYNSYKKYCVIVKLVHKNWKHVDSCIIFIEHSALYKTSSKGTNQPCGTYALISQDIDNAKIQQVELDSSYTVLLTADGMHEKPQPCVAWIVFGYLEEVKLVLDWPAINPDMNPIDHVWYYYSG